MPKELTEEQIKFWLANTSLTRDQLLSWYKSFFEFSLANDKLDQENFVKFFDKLQHKGTNAQAFYKLAFKAFDKDNSGAIGNSGVLLWKWLCVPGGANSYGAISSHSQKSDSVPVSEYAPENVLEYVFGYRHEYVFGYRYPGCKYLPGTFPVRIAPSLLLFR